MNAKFIAGSPRIAILAPLVATLAVTVIDPAEASFPRIAADTSLVAAVLVAAALDERSRDANRFRSPVERRALPGWVSYPVITSTFAFLAVAASLLVTPALTAFAPQRAGFPVPADVTGAGSRLLNHFADIHENLTDLSGTALFTVTYDRETDTGTRIRLLTLPDFERDGFFEGDPGADTPGPVLVEHEVTILTPFDDAWLPAVPGVMSVEPAVGTLVAGGVTGRQSAGLSYRVASRPADPAGSPPASTAAPHRSTLELDGIADLETVRAQASRIVAGAAGDLASAIAIERHLRSRTYRLAEDPGAVDLTQWLLDDDATGYCEQFSVAMAVLTRSLGIPSRVVLGFLPGALSGRTTTVTGAEAHAWVEVWIESYGWLPFDPTPATRRGAVSYGASYEGLVLAGQEQPTVTVPATSAPPTTIAAGEPGIRAGGWVLAVIAVFIGLGFIAALGARTRASTRRRAEAGDVTAAWDAIVDRLTESGRPPPPSSTPLEIARSTTDAMTGLAMGYTKLAYGTAVLDHEEKAVALESMRMTDAELRAGTPPVRRAFSATGLPALGRRLQRR